MEFDIKKLVLWIPAWLGFILLLDAFAFLMTSDHDVLIIFFPLFALVTGISLIWLIAFLYLFLFKREEANKGIIISSIIGFASLWPAMGIVATNMY